MPYLIADSRRSIQAETTDSQKTPNFVYDPSNFVIELERPINKVVAIELLHAEIPPTPSVILDWNDLILFYDNNTTASIVEATLTEGYYTPDEFINMANGVMTTAGSSTFTSTYDANSNKYTINSSIESRPITGAEAYAALIAGTITQLQYSQYFRTSYLFGIALGPSAISSLSTSYTLNYETDLRGIRYFTCELELNGFGNSDIVSAKDTTSFYIPKNSDTLIAFSRVEREGNFKLLNKINNMNVNHVHIRTFYEDSRKANEYFSGDLQFLFKIYKRDDGDEVNY